jgi:hypothetical protein
MFALGATGVRDITQGAAWLAEMDRKGFIYRRGGDILSSTAYARHP